MCSVLHIITGKKTYNQNLVSVLVLQSWTCWLVCMKNFSQLFFLSQVHTCILILAIDRVCCGAICKFELLLFVHECTLANSAINVLTRSSASKAWSFQWLLWGIRWLSKLPMLAGSHKCCQYGNCSQRQCERVHIFTCPSDCCYLLIIILI